MAKIYMKDGGIDKFGKPEMYATKRQHKFIKEMKKRYSYVKSTRIQCKKLITFLTVYRNKPRIYSGP
jgi:hypothetical protein